MGKTNVALLAEGVDRNKFMVANAGEDDDVALLAEGVDRNVWLRPSHTAVGCRPPRGGRG